MKNSIHGTKDDFKKLPWEAFEIKVVQVDAEDVITASDNSNDVMVDDNSWNTF